MKMRFEQVKGRMIFLRTAGDRKTLEKLKNFLYNKEIYCCVFESSMMGIRLFINEQDYQEFLQFCGANNIEE